MYYECNTLVIVIYLTYEAFKDESSVESAKYKEQAQVREQRPIENKSRQDEKRVRSHDNIGESGFARVYFIDGQYNVDRNSAGKQVCVDQGSWFSRWVSRQSQASTCV